MKLIPIGLRCTACVIVALAYATGYYHSLLILVLLLMILAVVSLAMRMDYTLVISDPAALQTQTFKSLFLAMEDPGEQFIERPLYVEGVNAYHPIAGAFLARIGGVPSIVLTPGQHSAE